jgi:hypothetical protein
VLADDPAGAAALGPGGADVRLVEDLDDAGAQLAGSVSDFSQSNRCSEPSSVRRVKPTASNQPNCTAK